MIAFIILCYSALYYLIFSKLQLLQKSTKNISAFLGFGITLIAAIIFSWNTFSPMSADARMGRYIIPIVPNVKGHVESVNIEAMNPVKKGQVLFTIDPSKYEFAVRRIEAQIAQHQAQVELAVVNLQRAKKLLKTQAAAQVDVDIWQAEKDVAAAAIDVAKAQLADAMWQLEETNVKAPYDGFVPNLQLRPGNYVTSIPMASPMAFVSEEVSELVVSFSQSGIRRIETGNTIEVSFTTRPGEIYSGRITKLAKVSSQAQFMASSQLPAMTGAPATDRWMARVELDDEEAAKAIPQGAGGVLAVYTNSGKPLHIISRVALRMNAWLNYLTAP